MSAASCQSCVHWKPFVGPGYDPADTAKLGLCGRIVSEDRYRGDEENDFVDRPDEAMVTDLSDCVALRTAASFGCSLHNSTIPKRSEP